MNPSALLPLTPLYHAVLLALADEDRHGYSILREIERMQNGTSVGTGTLYTALQRMLDLKVIAESNRTPRADEDQRRRYYTLTVFGRAVAVAETNRLMRSVRIAAEKRLISGSAALEGSQ